MPEPRPPQESEPADHDGHWKDALDAYFEPCLRLFWPALHAEIDWSVAPVFRDKELQRLGGARRRGRRHVDKLVEVRLRDARRVLLLIHLEVQARLDAAFLPRMYVYHYRLLDKHPGCELIHLAILTRSAGGEPMLNHRQAPLSGRFGHVEFVFPVIHLAGWVQRCGELLGMAGGNPFALVVLAELEAAEAGAPSQRLARKTALVRLLYEHGYGEADVRRLFAFIDGVLTLPPALEHEFTAVLDELEGEYEVAYITSVERVWTRKGLEQGLAQGRMEGRSEGRSEGLRGALLAQLERRFGPLPEGVRARVDAAPADALQDWLLRVLDAPTLDDVLR